MRITIFAFAHVFLFGCAIVIADQVDFDELALPPESFFDGYGAGAVSGSWFSQGVEFNTNQFGPGWSYSNVSDTTTAGFGNQWAAITGSGVGSGGNYALANSFAPNGAFINLPDPAQVDSIMVTNTTYAALSMREGDSFAKKFGGVSGDDPDFFRVTFTGFDGLAASGSTTGSVEFFLADYRFNDNSLDYIVDQWVQVDLSPLGDLRSLAISFDGSDVGSFGLNTPAYVAVDNLRFSIVPEPASVSCQMLLVLCLVALRNRSRKATPQRLLRT